MLINKIQFKPTVRFIKDYFGVLAADMERGGVFKVMDPGTTYLLLKIVQGSSAEEIIEITESKEKLQGILNVVFKYFGELFISFGDFIDKTLTYHKSLNVDDFLYDVDDNVFLEAFNGFYRATFPAFIEILPTLRCHLNCFYCYIKNKRIMNEIDPELVIENLYELVKKGRLAGVRFIGGEPLLRKEFVIAISKFLSKYKVYVEIFTKHPINETLAKQLHNAGVDRIVLSIDSLRNEYLKKITRVNLDLANDFKASIENLKKHGMRVCTNSTISKINKQEVETLVKNFIEMKVDSISISGYLRSHPSDPKSLLLQREDINDIRGMIKKAIENYPHKEISDISIVEFEKHTTGVYTSIAGGFGVLSDYYYESHVLPPSVPRRVYHRCSAYRDRIAIMPNGDIIGCNSISTLSSEFYKKLVIGNITNESLIAAWNSKRAKILAFPPQEKFLGFPCAKCKFFETCVKYYGFCYVKSANFFKSLFAQSTECRFLKGV